MDDGSYYTPYQGSNGYHFGGGRRTIIKEKEIIKEVIKDCTLEERMDPNSDCYLIPPEPPVCPTCPPPLPPVCEDCPPPKPPECVNCDINPVPEPCTMLLLGTGLICMAGIGRKKIGK